MVKTRFQAAFNHHVLALASLSQQPQGSLKPYLPVSGCLIFCQTTPRIAAYPRGEHLPQSHPSRPRPNVYRCTHPTNHYRKCKFLPFSLEISPPPAIIYTFSHSRCICKHT